MRTMIIAATALALLAGYASAQEREQGWGLFFNRDTFDGSVYPVAMMAEAGDSFSKHNVGVACDSDGTLAPFLRLPIMFTDPGVVEVEFRAGDIQRRIAFSADDVPNLGNQLRAKGADKAAFEQLFASGADTVAFRLDDGPQGRFSAIAADRVFEIIKQNCQAD